MKAVFGTERCPRNNSPRIILKIFRGRTVFDRAALILFLA